MEEILSDVTELKDINLSDFLKSMRNELYLEIKADVNQFNISNKILSNFLIDFYFKSLNYFVIFEKLLKLFN